MANAQPQPGIWNWRSAALRILARVVLATLITVALQLANPVWAYIQPEHFGWQTAGTVQRIALSLFANLLFAACILVITYAGLLAALSVTHKSASMDKRFFAADLLAMGLLIVLIALPGLFGPGVDSLADSHGALVVDGKRTPYGAAAYVRDLIEVLVFAAIFLAATRFFAANGRARRTLSVPPAGSSPDS